MGALRLLEAIRTLGLEKKTRFYQLSFVMLLFGLYVGLVRGIDPNILHASWNPPQRKR